MFYTVKDVAEITGVTLRTLRYYDSIGLLHPSKRSEAGYRLYNDTDLEVLQQILFYREMEFPLEKILELLNTPNYDRLTALQTQAEYLQKCAERYWRLAQLARNTLQATKGWKPMKKEEMFSAFTSESVQDLQKQYEQEVKERWGQTEAYRVSAQRTSRYTQEDWEKIMRLQNQNVQELASCFNQNLPINDEQVQKLVDEARSFIDQYFYPCSPNLFRELGNMYVCDSRFKENYDRVAEGLAEYYNQAIQFYCNNASNNK